MTPWWPIFARTLEREARSRPSSLTRGITFSASSGPPWPATTGRVSPGAGRSRSPRPNRRRPPSPRRRGSYTRTRMLEGTPWARRLSLLLVVALAGCGGAPANVSPPTPTPDMLSVLREAIRQRASQWPGPWDGTLGNAGDRRSAYGPTLPGHKPLGGGTLPTNRGHCFMTISRVRPALTQGASGSSVENWPPMRILDGGSRFREAQVRSRLPPPPPSAAASPQMKGLCANEVVRYA